MIILLILLSLGLVSAQDSSNDNLEDTNVIQTANVDGNVLNSNDYSNLKESENEDINSHEITEYDENINKTVDNQIIKNKDNNTKSAAKKITPTVRLSDYTIYRNETSTFYARILDENVTGVAIFKINGITISDKIEVQNGIASTDYTIPVNWGVINHTLTFVYAGNDKYSEIRQNSTLTLEYDGDRLDPNLKTSSYEIKYNQSVQFKVSLNESATGKVAFKVKNRTVGIVNVGDGGAICEYDPKGIVPGRYRVSVVYSGDYRFNEKRLDTYLTIVRISSTITTINVTSKAGSPTIFKATVIDEYNNKVANLPVSFKLNTGTIGTVNTSEDGVATLNIKTDYKLDKKSYNITASSGTTKTMEGNRTSAILTMTQLSTKTIVPTVNAKPGDKITLSTSVLDENNNPVLQGNVTYYINGKKYAFINIQSGFARYTYSIPGDFAGTIDVQAVFTGNWKYANSNGSGKISITQLSTRTHTENILTKPGFASQFKATVVDQNQKNVTGGIVVFRLNGKIIGNATVSKGVATLRYVDSMTSAGKYSINATYLGNDLYKSSSDENIYNVSQLKITVTGSNLTTIVGKPIVISVNLRDESRYNVEKGEVKFYINNTYIGKSSVVKGVANITYTPPLSMEAKLLRYTANYTKNDIYENATFIGNLTVNKQLEVYVSPSGNDKNFGNKTHPFKTIKEAVKHVSLLGTIHLADGTYKENGILINNSVKIIGTSPTKCIIDGSNSKMIFNASIEKYSLELQSVTVQHGKSSIANTAGAIYTAGLFIAKNVIFTQNSATGVNSAGAIYSIGSLNLSSVQFINNTLSSSNAEGAAIRTINNNTTIINSRFSGNVAKASNSASGAAIYANRVRLIIMNTTFNKHNASGVNVTGGTLKIVNSTASLYNVVISNSYSKASNTGMGGAICDLSSNMELNNVTLDNNIINATSIASGGSIYIESSQLEITKSNLTNNKVYAKNVMGGAISTYYGITSIIGSNFNKNIAKSTNNTFGGAIYHYLGTLYIVTSKLNNQSATGNIVYGGAIYFDGSTLKINYTQIDANKINATNTGLAGGIYTDANTEIIKTNFTNNKVSGNQVGGGAMASLGDLVVSQSNFISNNASNVGNAITGVQNLVTISGNYWGSNSPTWKNELKGLTTPSSYSKTKI